MNKGSHGYVVVRPAGCPTQLTSDRPSVDAEGQSWCGACESIEGPWRMNKAWMTHAPAVGFLAATVGPITARARDPSSPAHETQPAIQACTAELPATARWSQRRHPSHPPSATPASNIQLSSIICPPACLFLSLHGLRRVTEYFWARRARALRQHLLAEHVSGGPRWHLVIGGLSIKMRTQPSTAANT